MPVAPPAERPLADPKQLSRFHLAQLRPFRTAPNIFKTHPTYALVNACPIHLKTPLPGAKMTGHFTSYKTRPNQELTTRTTQLLSRRVSHAIFRTRSDRTSLLSLTGHPSCRAIGTDRWSSNPTHRRCWSGPD